MPGDFPLREETRAGIDASMTQINSVRQQLSVAVQGSLRAIAESKALMAAADVVLTRLVGTRE